MSRRGWIVIGAVAGLWTLALVALGALAIGSLDSVGAGRWDERAVDGTGAQKVALIRVAGEITGGSSEGGLFSGVVAGARDLVSQIRQAERDDDVVAILVRLETPGGEVVASDEVHRALRRAASEKVVVASMGDVAASGGYYIASAARRIVADPATWTGSIGVIAILPDMREASEKIGLRARVIKSGAFKDAGSPFRELRPEEQEYFQRLIDEAYEQFVGVVAEGRKMPVERVKALADGRVYSGRQAKENGLVDELGDQETAYELALKLAELDRDQARLVEYERSASFSDLFRPSLRSPVEQAKRDLGLRVGMQYLFLPGS